jgi:excisionase family DNA binding protein
MNDMNSINDKWLTIDELVAYLKMGKTKLYTMAQKGEIPGSKVGSQWRFDREEIDEWIKSGRAAKREKKRDDQS